jgi:hypothetical protein
MKMEKLGKSLDFSKHIHTAYLLVYDICDD